MSGFNGIPILGRGPLPPEQVLNLLLQERAKGLAIYTMQPAFLNDLIAALEKLPPPSETITMGVGPNEFVDARVATNWVTMRLQEEGGPTHVGLALATGPTDAIIARMNLTQTRKLIFDLTEKGEKTAAESENGN